MATALRRHKCARRSIVPRQNQTQWMGITWWPPWRVSWTLRLTMQLSQTSEVDLGSAVHMDDPVHAGALDTWTLRLHNGALQHPPTSHQWLRRRLCGSSSLVLMMCTVRKDTYGVNCKPWCVLVLFINRCIMTDKSRVTPLNITAHHATHRKRHDGFGGRR